MFVFNNLLHWANAEGGLEIEYFEEGFGFFQNNFEHQIDMESLVLLHPSQQVEPIPLYPPDGLQVILDQNSGIFLLEISFQYSSYFEYFVDLTKKHQ